MQAVYIEQYGNAQQLKLGHVEKPAVAAHQVLIKVEGAGVNPVDWMVRDGLLKDSGMHELPLILGWDAAGEVAQVGSDVDNFKVGDAVYVYSPISDQGTYAQYIAVDSTIVAAKPKSLHTLTAAGVPLAATTAWQALMEGCQLKAGDTVLIHNAAGGVGSFAVQIAKAHGAHVIGTASAAKEAYVRDLGADEFIDYRSQRFEDVIGEVDAVLAAVGGDDILNRSFQVIRKGGYLVSLLDELDERGVDLGKQGEVNYQRWWVTPNAQDLQSIATLIDNGKIKVNIEKVFPLSQVAQAHALSETQRACGKIIINVTA